MADYDQDAVDAAVAVLQPQIDALQTDAHVPVAVRNPVRYIVEYDDGSRDVFDLVPS